MPQTIYTIYSFGYSGQRGHSATTTVHTLDVAGGGTQDVRVTIVSDDPDEIEFASYGVNDLDEAFLRPGRDFWTGSGDTTDELYTFTFTEEPGGDPVYLDSFAFDFREFGDPVVGTASELATEAFYIEVDRGDGNGYQRVTFQSAADGSISYTVHDGDPGQFSIDSNGVFTADGSGVTSGGLEARGTVTINGPLVGFRMQYIETAPSGSPNYSDTDGFELDQPMTAGDVVCFAGDMPIDTPLGPCSAEQIRAGDVVSTLNGPMQVRWAGRSHIIADGKRAPVRISAGTLGPNLPSRDVLLSRQHRVLIETPALRLVTGHSAALVPAIQLTKLPGIYVDQQFERITYVHILLESHEIVSVHGLPCETFFPGTMAQMALTPKAEAEIRAIFPDISAPPFELAFPVVSGKTWRATLAKLKKPMLH